MRYNIEHPRWRTYTMYKILNSLKEISPDQPCFLLFTLSLLGYRLRPITAIIRLQKT
jgi:hypothetical protein